MIHKDTLFWRKDNGGGWPFPDRCVFLQEIDRPMDTLDIRPGEQVTHYPEEYPACIDHSLCL